MHCTTVIRTGAGAKAQLGEVSSSGHQGAPSPNCSKVCARNGAGLSLKQARAGCYFTQRRAGSSWLLPRQVSASTYYHSATNVPSSGHKTQSSENTHPATQLRSSKAGIHPSRPHLTRVTCSHTEDSPLSGSRPTDLLGTHTDRFLPEHKARSGRQEGRPVITWLGAVVGIKARLPGRQLEGEREESRE